jgi:hypothetical protein
MHSTHRLKTWPQYFEALTTGLKSFEVRNNDRGFTVGDWLILEEYDPISKTYSGRQVTRTVDYILNSGFGLSEGHCVMAISKL